MRFNLRKTRTLLIGIVALAAALVLAPVAMRAQSAYAPGAQMVYLTGSAYTNATTGFTSVTGLSFAIPASTNMHATCRITWQGSAGTTGPKYQWTGPSAPTAVAASAFSIITATTATTSSVVAFSGAMANAGTITGTTNFTDTVDVSVLNGVNAGTVQLQAAANGAGTLTIQPGSYCMVN